MSTGLTEYLDKIESLGEKVARYERFLRALFDDGARSPAYACLGSTDAIEWIAEQAAGLLDGCEADCPNCSTPLHDGACVSADGGEGDEIVPASEMEGL